MRIVEKQIRVMLENRGYTKYIEFWLIFPHIFWKINKMMQLIGQIYKRPSFVIGILDVQGAFIYTGHSDDRTSMVVIYQWSIE